MGQEQTMTQDGPYLQVSCTGERIRTLAQLLEACEADLQVHDVVDWQARSWEQAQKGPNKGDPPVVVPMFLVGAKFRPKVLSKPRFDVHSVTVVVEVVRQAMKRGRRRKNYKRWLLWSDPHFGYEIDEQGQLIPFHDERMLRALEVLLAEEDFDGSICLGDLLDLAEFSDKFTPLPGYQRTAQQAVVTAAEWLARLWTKALIEGNHEQRVRRALLKYLQAAYELKSVDELEGHPAFSIPKLLGMAERGIEWVGGYPTGEKVIGDVHLFHGDVARKGSETTARAYLNDTGYSAAFGHIHRPEKAERYENGKQQVSMAVGCACRIDGVVPGHNPRHQNWQQGAGVLTEYEDGTTQLEVVPVVDGVAVWHGKEYKA